MAQLKVFKFMATLGLVFRTIESDYEIKCDTFYSNSKAEKNFNEGVIDNVFESIYLTVMSNKQNIFRKRFTLYY